MSTRASACKSAIESLEIEQNFWDGEVQHLIQDTKARLAKLVRILEGRELVVYVPKLPWGIDLN